MGKAAGIWKKVKNLGKSIGGKFKKAYDWVNENIIRPNKGLINNVVDMVDPTGIGNKIINNVSDWSHDKLHPEDEENTVYDPGYAEPIKNITDNVVQMTQDTNRYNNGFDSATPLNNIIREGINVGKHGIDDIRKRTWPPTGGIVDHNFNKSRNRLGGAGW